MKYGLPLLLIAISCTGSLTDEQRKKMRENMELNEIKKVTEAQITDAAFQLGRQVAVEVSKVDKTLTNPDALDSIAQVYQVEIIRLHVGNENLRMVERQILEAYQAAAGSDNIQKLGPDSLLYTKPLWREHPDGSTEFLKALGVRMTRKQIVTAIH